MLKKYPYRGPLPIFTVPFGGGLLPQLQKNDGKYKGFNKCSLYYENTNYHYSQGCRCYWGHCYRCCTCNHNNINDPNLPLGAVSDKLKKSLQNLLHFLKNMSLLNQEIIQSMGIKEYMTVFLKTKMDMDINSR